MRINRQGALNRTASTRRSSSSANSSEKFSINQSGPETPASTVQGARPLTTVDALLAIQEVPDASTPTRRAVRHAEDILDVLDELKLGLLMGSLPRSRLNRLLSLVRREQDRVPDPKLSEVLKEVELRAHVELAKLGEIA